MDYGEVNILESPLSTNADSLRVCWMFIRTIEDDVSDKLVPSSPWCIGLCPGIFGFLLAKLLRVAKFDCLLLLRRTQFCRPAVRERHFCCPACWICLLMSVRVTVLSTNCYKCRNTLVGEMLLLLLLLHECMPSKLMTTSIKAAKNLRARSLDISKKSSRLL
jgi:hypothetical protein